MLTFLIQNTRLGESISFLLPVEERYQKWADPDGLQAPQLVSIGEQPWVVGWSAWQESQQNVYNDWYKC
jgi:hypothetical protein